MMEGPARRAGTLGGVLLLAASLAGAESSPRGLPIAEAVLSRQWNGQWIACAGAPERDAGVYRFRKVLDLPAAGKPFVVHVSGDQRFQLFANGQRVGIGPSRGDIFHWRFETFDLAPFLKPGENLLVATVWNFGTQAPAAQVSDRTGFVLQGDGPDQAVANTDASWQCASEPGHQPWAEGVKAIKALAYVVVGPGERLDAARYDWSWREPPAEGRGAWKAAVPYGAPSPRSIQEGPGHALSPEGRLLVPDELPPMEYRPVPAGTVVRASGAALADGFPEKPTTVPPATKATLLLDRRVLVAAYPRLAFSGGAGARVRLSYQEALIKDRFTKDHRNEIEGKRLVGISDEVLPDGGSARVFEPLWWRTWRYLQIDVETAGEALTLDGLTAYATGYPFEERARWDAGEPTLARVWEVGWRTARLCAHETYVDCPYYEQLQYVGDTRVQALLSYTVAGDDRLARQAILAYDHSRRSDGLTSSRYPAATPQYIPPFSLLWVGMVHDYWRYRDDPAFVAARLPATRSVLDWFLARRRPDGLVGRLPWWNFVDWAADFAAGVPPQDAEGGSAAITLQLVAALDEAAALEDALGDPRRAEDYRQAATKARGAALRLCWNPARGLLADVPASAHFSQQTNILAILTGALPRGQAGAVLDRLLAAGPISTKTGARSARAGDAPGGEPGLTKASYYFRFYLARALEALGRGDDYLPQLEPWREMLDLGLSTWAETPDLAARSDCHAWSAHPNYDLLTIVAGIKPGAPGFKTVRIEPHLGTLDHLEAALPHPRGLVEVSYRREADGLTATVTLPPGLAGTFVWKGRSRPLASGTSSLRLP